VAHSSSSQHSCNMMQTHASTDVSCAGIKPLAGGPICQQQVELIVEISRLPRGLPAAFVCSHHSKLVSIL
jgi:hypothetical protein